MEVSADDRIIYDHVIRPYLDDALTDLTNPGTELQDPVEVEYRLELMYPKLYEYCMEQNEKLAPLVTWEAYAFARQHGRELPDFVLRYLDECAARVLTAPRRTIAREVHVYEALAFRKGSHGRGTLWSQFTNLKRRFHVARLCLIVKEREETEHEVDVYDRVCELLKGAGVSVSRSQIENFYRQFF